MKTYSIADDLKLVDLAPPISGFEKFNSTYVLKAKKVALVDVGPSTSAENLMSALAELNINLTDIGYVFLTHIHIDHAGGLGKAIKQMPNATVVVHEKGKPYLVDPAKLWEGSQRALGKIALEYGPIDPVPPDRIITAEEGMTINLGEMDIEVLITPGHAPHHLSFLHRKEGRLFAGEAAGVYLGEVDLVRPATPLPFNLEQALTSLDKLIRLEPKSLYYAHFGYAADVLDKLYNHKKQLILWGSIIANYMDKEARWEEIYSKIREKDVALARADGLPSNQRHRELFFAENSIKGFVGYFRRCGTEYIKRYEERGEVSKIFSKCH